ncbi:MAG: thioredoxin family protein [Anaerolineae bacterium]
MEIKVLGTGCPNCLRLERVAREAAQEAGMQAEFVKVTDIAEIMTYPILGTPGLVINGKVKSSGRIPRKEEIIAWLKEAKG